MLEVAPAPAQTDGTPVPGRAAIASVAAVVPEHVRGNAEIAERIGVDESWIVERTGVRERRIAPPEQGLVELATQASEQALQRAGVEASEIDLVLAATMSHENLTPNLAPLVASELGIGAGALDIGAACTGFVGALSMAVPQIETGRAEAVLVIGADLMSRIVDQGDRSTAALFADGAGAVVVRPTATGSGVGPVVMGSDGARGDLVVATREEALLRMQGQDTFREAVARLCEVTEQAAEAAGVAVADIDAFVYHQANARILRAVGQRLRLPSERVVECISRFGNTSAASLPIALADALKTGLLQPGGRVLLSAFGGGLTWGATVAEWEGQGDE